MFDHKSDYALNKYDPDAIVCRSVTDVHIRLTRADFANEEEFQKWKEWSDHDYHAAEKAGRGFYDHVLPLDERLDAAEPSLEELMLGAIELAARDADRTMLMQKIRTCLSTTQFRRMWMRYAEGKSVTEIAELEGVSKAGISLTLHTARKKLKKTFKTT